MTKDINDFVNIVTQKNGRVRFTHNADKEKNIYTFLREIGFRSSKKGTKRIYFRRDKADIIPVSFQDIKDVFADLLEKTQFINIPNGSKHSDILEWYYSKQPVKEGASLNLHLQDALTDSEMHNYCLKSDSSYKQQFKTQQLLSKLDEWNFIRTIDTIGTFSKGRFLYYKKINEKRYLVFNHYNPQLNSGFDVWVAIYNNESHVGSQKPLSTEHLLKKNFNLDTEFDIIKDFID